MPAPGREAAEQEVQALARGEVEAVLVDQARQRGAEGRGELEVILGGEAAGEAAADIGLVDLRERRVAVAASAEVIGPAQGREVVGREAREREAGKAQGGGVFVQREPQPDIDRLRGTDGADLLQVLQLAVGQSCPGELGEQAGGGGAQAALDGI
ncbi:hypothetical protein [Roseateles flavus]|uniref:Uncharacterized protein n=1 Tax=Roseateles flavus TaxID=3149041 RepID=A0ABV0GL75_9BURK